MERVDVCRERRQTDSVRRNTHHQERKAQICSDSCMRRNATVRWNEVYKHYTLYTEHVEKLKFIVV